MGTEFKGLVRARDPESSWDAAARQDLSRREQVKAAILTILLNHKNGLSDEQIADYYEAHRFAHPSIPAVTDQSLRTRRKALELEGKVHATGARIPTRHGATAAIWIAT
jgi:hypothetical protein